METSAKLGDSRMTAASLPGQLPAASFRAMRRPNARLGLSNLPILTNVRREFGRVKARAGDALARPANTWRAREGDVPIGRGIGRVVLITFVAPCWGCAHGPRDFRKIQSPAPVVRARAVGLGRSQPDSLVVPALVDRLGDADPVVRLAAYEELRKRTGRDFGYLPWASPEERASAIDRWRAWMNPGKESLRMARPILPPVPPGKTLPITTGQVPQC